METIKNTEHIKHAKKVIYIFFKECWKI